MEGYDEREGINRRVEIKKRGFCMGTSILRFSALAATMKVWMFPMFTLTFAKSTIDVDIAQNRLFDRVGPDDEYGK